MSEEKKSTRPESPRAETAAKTFRVPASNPWANAWKLAAGVGVAGLVIGGAGYSANPNRFAFSYLLGFEVALSIALGATFFVIIQHLTSAGWSVTVRRTGEFLSYGLVIMALLFAPVWGMKERLFPWIGKTTGEHHASTTEVSTTHLTQHTQEKTPTDGPAREPKAGEQHGVDTSHGATSPSGVANQVHGSSGHGAAMTHGAPDPHEMEEAHIMHKKSWWLTLGFFNFRAVLYFLIWAGLGYFLFSRSVKQDSTKDVGPTKALKTFAAPAAILFALSLTFAGFDWVMSLQPMWFSTIFGVYLFAGSFVAALAVIILIAHGLRQTGLMQKEITVEHFHDLGKLLFGFNVFWAYIGFSQFMLIWYAALPEETPFYHARWYTDTSSHIETGWKFVSLSLLFVHFVIPFVFLISRNVKRRLQLLPIGAAILLFMHVVDIYWLVMPNVPNFELGQIWIDIGCVLGVVGIYAAFVFKQMASNPLIPMGDPRLPRALHFENV